MDYYENFTAVKSEMHDLANRLNFHDYTLIEQKMDYAHKRAILTLGVTEQERGRLICENCAYFLVTDASLWMEKENLQPWIYDMNLEEDFLMDELLRDACKGVNYEPLIKQYHNNLSPEHFCLTFLTMGGDVIRIVATCIRWERMEG